jgi:hypothetical protein
MPEPFRVYRSWIAAVSLVVLSIALEWSLTRELLWPGADGFVRGTSLLGDDFVNGWAGIRFALSGKIDLLFDADDYTDALGQLFGREVAPHLWSYPPTALLLYLPFLHAGFFWSFGLWSIAGLVVYVLAARCYLGRWQGPALLLVLFAPSSWHNLFDGQNGYLTAALFVAGCASIRRYPALAGILFGLLTFKPQLGLILPFALLALKAWRVILFACLTAAVFAGIAVTMFGIDPWIDYATYTLPTQADQLADFDGFFTCMLVSLYAGLRSLDVPNGPALAAQAVCAVIVVALACRAIRRTGDVPHRTLILASAVPLLTPYGYTYDMGLLAIPLAGALTASDYHPWRRLVFAFAWLAPVLVILIGLSDDSQAQILCPVILLTCFCAAITHDAEASPEGLAAEAETITLAQATSTGNP